MSSELSAQGCAELLPPRIHRHPILEIPGISILRDLDVIVSLTLAHLLHSYLQHLLLIIFILPGPKLWRAKMAAKLTLGSLVPSTKPGTQ